MKLFQLTHTEFLSSEERRRAALDELGERLSWLVQGLENARPVAIPGRLRKPCRFFREPDYDGFVHGTIHLCEALTVWLEGILDSMTQFKVACYLYEALVPPVAWQQPRQGDDALSSIFSLSASVPAICRYYNLPVPDRGEAFNYVVPCVWAAVLGELGLALTAKHPDFPEHKPVNLASVNDFTIWRIGTERVVSVCRAVVIDGQPKEAAFVIGKRPQDHIGGAVFLPCEHVRERKQRAMNI